MSRDDRKNRLQQAGALVTCKVCDLKEPLLTAEDHHRTPRAFGGTDDAENRIWLCASCHKRLHRVQALLIHNKPHEGYDLAEQLFPIHADKRARLWQYANEAAKAEALAKDSFNEHRTHTKVSIDVETLIWEDLKEIAKKQKTSAKVIAAAIIEDAVKKAKGE